MNIFDLKEEKSPQAQKLRRYNDGEEIRSLQPSVHHKVYHP